MKSEFVLAVIAGTTLLLGTVLALAEGNDVLGLFLFFWGGLILTVVLLYPVAKFALPTTPKTRKFRVR